MKRNDWIFLASLAAYSFLFWHQAPGLNFLIMNCILAGGIILRDKSVLRCTPWLFAAGAALLTSACVAWYGNSLSVLANFAALFAMAAFVLHRRNSLIVAGFLGFINMMSAFVFIILAFAERAGGTNKSDDAPKRSFKKVILLAAVAFVGIIFVFLYRGSSLLFESLTNNINLSFISVFWCIFVIAGAVLLFGFYSQQKFAVISSWDSNLPMNLSPKERTSVFDKLMSLDSEYFTGIALFGMLNFLLLIVNGLDIAFLIGGEQCLPPDVTYSEYVHQGINTLILSIIFATTLILVWFRNYHESGKSYSKIRTLVLIWIFQNMFMIAVTIFRNHDYIFVFGLTYKRIGVDIYLLLALSGLALVFWKIIKQKSNAYVAKYFGWVCFAVLVFACPVNWDKLIFSYNAGIKHRLDMMYANSLSYLSLPEQHKYHEESYEMTRGENSSLQGKTFDFLSRHRYLHERRQWPSYNIAANSVYNELITMNLTEDSAVYADNCGVKAIYYFPCYSGITTLSLTNNNIEETGEVWKYESLTNLDLRYNHTLHSIAGIEHCRHLIEIDLRGTSVNSYNPLMLMPQLRTLYVDYLDAETEANLKAMNPNLTIQNY